MSMVIPTHGTEVELECGAKLGAEDTDVMEQTLTETGIINGEVYDCSLMFS